MEQTNQTDLLQDWEKEMYLIPVSNWVRFGNYIIDGIIISLITKLADYVTNYAAMARLENEDITSTYYIMMVVIVQMSITLVTSFAYYAIFEGATNGRTLGKLITSSIAVKDNGGPVTFREAALRSLCRLIPFNAISALFGAPWHDSITRTMVITKQ